jgi:SAM-dependent methyltransferase
MSEAGTAAQAALVEDWAGAMGERWLANLDRFESMIGPVGEALMEHAAFAPGERVVDIGCGAGGTSLEIARRVGTRGEVLGIDISPALAHAAASRARQAAISNVRFLTADAATVQLDSAFDRLFSRFGTMFFTDFAAAFTNLHRMIRASGRADLAVWAPARENPWIADMRAILERYIELPTPVPRAPGPFALEEPDYVRTLLASAGFRSIAIERWRGQQLVGGAGASPADAADFALNGLSLGDAARDQPQDVRLRVTREITELFARHRTAAGIQMSATAWIVTARA